MYSIQVERVTERQSHTGEAMKDRHVALADDITANYCDVLVVGDDDAILDAYYDADDKARIVELFEAAPVGDRVVYNRVVNPDELN